jgi:anti-sigma-K factor RskA
MTPLQHPEVVDPLAAEYVLGTLRGPARRRFERWRVDSPLVQERCRFWEENLMYLAARGLRPIQPPPHVWQRILIELNLSRGEQPRRRSMRPLAIAASVLVVMGLAGLLYWRSTLPGRVSEVASISASSGQQMWQVEVYGQTAQIIVRASPAVARPTDKDYELWALPTGGKPVSLGLMPAAGSARRTLTPTQQQALANTQQVAVTLEQVGGSPTGQPTSTPIFVVPLKVAS